MDAQTTRERVRILSGSQGHIRFRMWCSRFFLQGTLLGWKARVVAGVVVSNARWTTIYTEVRSRIAQSTLVEMAMGLRLA